MKYRIVKRAKGWVVQSIRKHPPYISMVVGADDSYHEWHTVAVWRWRFLAALHLLWLRERARK